MEILIKDLQDKLKLKKALIGRAARAALMARRMAKRQGALSLCFVGDVLIRRLNARFHSSNHSTDVLAFDISRSKSDDPINDVVISVDTAIKNALKFRTSPDYELCLYVVHGVLHLSGLSDRTAKQRQVMDKKAGDILKKVIKVKKYGNTKK